MTSFRKTVFYHLGIISMDTPRIRLFRSFWKMSKYRGVGNCNEIEKSLTVFIKAEYTLLDISRSVNEDYL